jgi:minor curlin subunit
LKVIQHLTKFHFILFATFVASNSFAKDIDESTDLVESVLSLSLQPTINSSINIEQLGSHNSAVAIQSGLDNQIKLTQLGDSNEIVAVQYGESNLLNVTQFGDNNKADVYQFGSFNTANITQSGNQYFLLEQYSDFGVVNITQF